MTPVSAGVVRGVCPPKGLFRIMRQRMLLLTVALASYTFVGYPVLLWLIARLRGRPVHTRPLQPSLSIIIPAHNEEAYLREKLESVVSQDYPCDKMEILVVSDGSTDATADIASAFADAGVHLLELPRVGKTAAINAGVAATSNDILVLTDANAILAPGALSALTANFADPTVGGVSANEQRLPSSHATAVGLGERVYWSYDKWMKRQESRAGSMVSASGSLYAIRRSVFQPITDLAAHDDFSISTQPISHRLRLVFEPDAITYEPMMREAEMEFTRKARIVARGMRSIYGVRPLLLPWNSGFYAVQLWSHKILRRMLGSMAIVGLALSLSLAQRRMAQLLLVGQLGFYGLALAGWLAEQRGWGKRPWLYVPYYACLSNAAATVGMIQFLKRDRFEAWEPRTGHYVATIQESTTEPTTARETPQTVAYLTSRFPKISETFILNEMLALQQLGMRIELFPLIHEREAVVHPDVSRLAGHVHYHSFWSLAVLDAQLHWLRRCPNRYVGAWRRAIVGNVRSPRFLARAFVVVPWAAYTATRMERLGVDHVHAHWATHPALAAYVINHLCGLPYSITAHANDLYVDQTMLQEKVNQADFVVTISEHNRAILEQVAPRVSDKVHVIHCGADLDLFQPMPAPHNGVFTIVCVGRLVEAKGHQFLLEACSILREQGIRFRCILAGEGEHRQAIETWIRKLKLDDVVELVGAQPRHAVRDLIATADVVVLPSITMGGGATEGIPVALMEALAMCRPVVATNVSGVGELIRHRQTGLLVPERDSPSLAAALGEVDTDRELARRLGEAGRALVEAEFDLRANAVRLYDLITQHRPADAKAADDLLMSLSPDDQWLRYSKEPLLTGHPGRQIENGPSLHEPANQIGHSPLRVVRR